MTQEEKFEEAKRLYETANADQRYVLESLFPELRESEDERIRKEIMRFIFDYPQKLANRDSWLAWLEKLKDEQKPAEWNEEEDIQMYRNVLFYLSKPSPLTEVNGKSREQLLDWFKSLKDRVQSKQEWSEEDERNLQGIIDEIEANKNQAPDYDLATYDRFLSWLKSLRHRSQWKPSDEQIKALDDAIAICSERDYETECRLDNLRQELKKLKE